MLKDKKTRAQTMNALKNAFPYYLPNDHDGSGVFYSAQVGNSDEHNVLVRINFEKQSYAVKEAEEYATFGVVDDERKQFLYGDIEGLQKKVSEILKNRIDKSAKERKDSMLTDIESMKLCGFLSRNNLNFSIEKHTTHTIVNIFGTAFEKLPIYIYKKDPDVYVIQTPRASFNREQLESFILTCKSLKE